MALKVKDVLQLQSLQGMKLVAGKKGLDRVVCSAGIADYEFAPDIEYHNDSPFDKESFVISSLLFAHNDEGRILEAVKMLYEMGTSAFAYKDIIYGQLPQEVVRFANEKGYPIFAFGPVSYTHLREIWNSCTVLKNLAIVHRGQPMSCDFILEQLMTCSRPLSNVYADILSAYRNGRGENAFDLLYEQVPVKAARYFSFILSRIDRIDPGELISHMIAFEETFAAERRTRGMRRAERRSLITTMAATATVFAVLLNFTVVVVLMDAMRLLGQAF